MNTWSYQWGSLIIPRAVRLRAFIGLSILCREVAGHGQKTGPNPGRKDQNRTQARQCQAAWGALWQVRALLVLTCFCAGFADQVLSQGGYL